MNGVYNRVAGDDDAQIGDAFGAKIGGGTQGGSEIQIGERRNEAAVHFFGEGAKLVKGAEAGFDVSNADFFLKCDESSGKGGRGVSLNEQPIGADFAKDRGQGLEDARGKFERGLVVLHEIQIVIGRDAKNAKHLVEKVAMLRGDTDMRFNAGGASSVNDGSHFDGFGTRAENGEDAHELFVRRGGEERVRDAMGQDRPIVRLDKAVPGRLPSHVASLYERIGPGGGIWFREKHVGPSETLPRFERRRDDDFATGGIFNDFDLKRKVRAGGDALGENADIERVEIGSNFGGMDAACSDDAVRAIGGEN